ncbi:9336_t:CDS:2, partial [Entrophospora sp. SA101]
YSNNNLTLCIYPSSLEAYWSKDPYLWGSVCNWDIFFIKTLPGSNVEDIDTASIIPFYISQLSGALQNLQNYYSLHLDYASRFFMPY